MRTALTRLRSPHPPIARIDINHIRIAVAAGTEHISAAVAVAHPHPMEAIGAHDSGSFAAADAGRMDDDIAIILVIIIGIVIIIHICSAEVGIASASYQP